MLGKNRFHYNVIRFMPSNILHYSLEFGKDLETLSPSLPLNPFATAFDNATEATLQHFVFPQVIWRISKIMGCGMDVELHQSVAKVKKYLSEINTIITLIRLGFSI
jgi:hypothetical protein